MHNCRTIRDGDVVKSTGQYRARDTPKQYPGSSSRKGGGPWKAITTKAMDFLKNSRSKTPPPQRTSNGFDDTSHRPSSHSYKSAPLNQLGNGQRITLPTVEKQDTRNQPASSSHGIESGSRDTDVYQTRAPPPGSYQDDDTGPSPKNLVMAVMGVKSAVNHFAKALISDMSKYPDELKHLKRRIRHEVQGEVDRANHWKFLVQAFVCQRLFESFVSNNGFFGIEQFDGLKYSSIICFQDFTKYKDKSATISGLLTNNSPEKSFLGLFCFKKFKSISGDLATTLPLARYEEEWSMIDEGRHPRTEFYLSFLKVAVSVWLLHQLVYSFEQGWSMLGWETFPKGCRFEKKNMESVVPGGYEEEDDETGTDVNTVVGFLVIPGFQVSKSVVKCEVYLRNKNSLDDGKIEEASETPSRDKSLEKSFSDKTPANYLTPVKNSVDKSPGIRESVKSSIDRTPGTGDSVKSSIYSGYSNGGDVEDSRRFWEDGKTRESLDRSRMVQGKSPRSKSGHLVPSKDRSQTTHYLGTQSASASSKQPRSTNSSRLREERWAKNREEENRRNGWTH
ncbi:hypothetical protein KC19_6G093200 [Ceratodon purpureus]|uniref:GIL1/IRKI C-terminal domain-containing protein n=1 Tax=Ceratodon purpureus TaxID=3225 RepID=A0A8T0HD79_CERPU|nr:hypothetical protein KC19_6G093200 [Ceratodon purpureus]